MAKEVPLKGKLAVIVRVTDHCNFRCPFCDYSQSHKRLRKSLDAKQFKFFLSCLDRFLSEKNRVAHVTFFGGEALLWKPIYELGAANFDHLDFGLTTNGSLFSDKILHFYLNDLAKITFSLDGPEAAHDAFRLADGPNYSQIVEAIVEIKRRDKNKFVRVATIVRRGSSSYFPSFCHMLMELGVDELIVNVLGNRHGYNKPFYQAHKPDMDEIVTIHGQVKMLRQSPAYAESGFHVSGTDGYFESLQAEGATAEDYAKLCLPVENTLYLGSDGTLSPCFETNHHFASHINQMRTYDEFLGVVGAMIDHKKTHQFDECDRCVNTFLRGKFTATAEAV